MFPLVILAAAALGVVYLISRAAGVSFASPITPSGEGLTGLALVSPVPLGPANISGAEFSRMAIIWPLIQAEAARNELDPAIVGGLISRETNTRNIMGDKGNGYGYMQIDGRYHSAFIASGKAMTPSYNIAYGTKFLASLFAKAKKAGLSGILQTRAALAAYNGGPDQIEKAVHGSDPDTGTTYNNYSKDVLSRADSIRIHFLQSEINS